MKIVEFTKEQCIFTKPLQFIKTQFTLVPYSYTCKADKHHHHQKP